MKILVKSTNISFPTVFVAWECSEKFVRQGAPVLPSLSDFQDNHVDDVGCGAGVFGILDQFTNDLSIR